MIEESHRRLRLLSLQPPITSTTIASVFFKTFLNLLNTSFLTWIDNMIKRDINQQQFQSLHLHFVKSELIFTPLKLWIVLLKQNFKGWKFKLNNLAALMTL